MNRRTLSLPTVLRKHDRAIQPLRKPGKGCVHVSGGEGEGVVLGKIRLPVVPTKRI